MEAFGELHQARRKQGVQRACVLVGCVVMWSCSGLRTLQDAACRTICGDETHERRERPSREQSLATAARQPSHAMKACQPSQLGDSA